MNFNANGIPINIPQYQQSRCRPEICVNCPKKYYCQHYTEFLESGAYVDFRSQMINTQQPMVQQPVIAQPIVQQPVIAQPMVQEPIVKEEIVIQQPAVQSPNIDISPLLDIMEKMQLQVQDLSHEINAIKSDSIKNKPNNIIKEKSQPIILPPPIIAENTATKLNVEEEIIVQDENFEEVAPTQESKETVDKNNGMIIYNSNDNPDTILVQKKTIFGK